MGGPRAEAMEVTNRLGEIRRKRGVAAADLAAQVGVSRQTIYAIEAGGYTPNTVVALRLAEALGVRVEELFSLARDSGATAKTQAVDLLGVETLAPGQPLRLCQIGRRTVGVFSSPAPFELPPADAIAAGPAGPRMALAEPLCDLDVDPAKRLLVAGCDPGMGVLARRLAREASVELITAGCSSLQALAWLREGKVHVAGLHLRDEASGELNVPAVKSVFPKGGYKIVTFAVWEEGLIVRKGNPKKIRSISDLGRPEVAIVNREQGAGSRFLLDRELKKAGIPAAAVRGYDRLTHGHIDAAWHVYAGQADCCLATTAAARVFGLDFIPLGGNRYDLVIPRRFLNFRAVDAMLDRMTGRGFRRELEALGGYETSQTGKIVL